MSQKTSTLYYLKQPRLLTNLIIMCLIWLSSSFCYYLILILSNTFDNCYTAGIINGSSELIAYFLAGIIYERIGVKLTLIISFLLSTVGGLLILFWGLHHQGSPLFSVFFLLAKFGVTITLLTNYAANSYFFPVLFSATAMGICNFLARFFSAFSYLVDKIEEPFPMIMFTGMCALSAVAALLLRTDKRKQTATKLEE